jgi:hypothetical protein
MKYESAVEFANEQSSIIHIHIMRITENTERSTNVSRHSILSATLSFPSTCASLFLYFLFFLHYSLSVPIAFCLATTASTLLATTLVFIITIIIITALACLIIIIIIIAATTVRGGGRAAATR